VQVSLLCLSIIIYPLLCRCITDIGVSDLAVPANTATKILIFSDEKYVDWTSQKNYNCTRIFDSRHLAVFRHLWDKKSIISPSVSKPISHGFGSL